MSGSVQKVSGMKKLDEAKRAVLAKCGTFPEIVVVLGSGLGGLVDKMEIETEISYDSIPHFGHVGVEGHAGMLAIGKLSGVRVAAMRGRFHFYEGHPTEEVVFPVRVFGACGANVFLLTNASGGMRSEWPAPTLMAISDHINLTGTNPLIGANWGELGPRFPDMSEAYDADLRVLMNKAAAKVGVDLKEGIYVGTHGPSFETPAEIRMFRALGADAVGMSTVPETIALRHMGKRVAAVSCITNLAAGVSPNPLSHREVLDNAQKAQAAFTALVCEWIAAVGASHGG